ncbi:KIF-binding protein-like [Leptidea sinapis]|uniref:KIF-binding protein n=1 Tax=Leptidea sinapis TaxID=189913 RepID=A0A5E4PMW7_9NEOP|nr:KIF-binding protein-like [Leptidea sinapis]VVC86343.1 unnamed protein product [Leptidea sinapis]
MDTILNRINKTFETLKNNFKCKNSPDKLPNLKNDIRLLQTDIIVLGRENHDNYRRSLAMEAFLALLTVKTVPLSLIDKRNILQSIYEKMRPYALAEECLFVFLRIQNLLCYNLIQLHLLADAREILEEVEELYDKIDESKLFYDAEDLFIAEPICNIKTMNVEKINNVITNNIQMQAFLYNKLDLPDKYTMYNHTVLRRQLEMKEGTPQDWALRTARLGNYFTYLNQLDHACYHLCASYHVLRTFHDNCKLMPKEFIVQKADIEVQFLELSHYWVKYGLTLFKLSRKNVLNKFFSQPTLKTDLWKTVNGLDDTLSNAGEYFKDIGPEKSGKGDSTLNDIFTFPTLNLNNIQNKVPSETVKTPEEARKLFAFTHKWLMRAKHYYDFEQHSSQYISCCLQLAELHEHLAFFEKNIDNQYTIQKRRADVLEALNSLLKTCDNVMTVQIDVIRELSQVQLELMALNLQKLWREESQTNVVDLDTDADYLINSLDSASSKTLTDRTLNANCKNAVLRKMEAATTLNGTLYRLSGQLNAKTPSELSLKL